MLDYKLKPNESLQELDKDNNKTNKFLNVF